MIREIGIHHLAQVIEFFAYLGFLTCFTGVKLEKRYWCYAGAVGILIIPQIMAECNPVLKENVVFLELVIMILVLAFMIKESWLRRICYSAGVYIFVGFIVILYSLITLWITGKEHEEVYDYSIILVLTIFIKYIIKKCNIEEKWRIPRFSIKIFTAFNILYFLGAGLLVRIDENVLEKGIFSKKEMISAVCIVAGIIVISIVLIISYMQLKHEREKVEFLQQYQKMQEEYFEIVQKGDLETRKFRHDMIGHMECIKELLKNQKYKEAEKYLMQAEKTVDGNPYKKYQCNHTVISALVNHMGSEMEASHIEFDFCYRINGQLRMSDFECCTLLYNLLKNAIEACMQIREGERKIALKMENFEQNLRITVSNSVRSDFESKYIENRTTSKKNRENHGIGMSNIKEVVERYQGDIRYTYEKNVVNAEAVLFQVVTY